MTKTNKAARKRPTTFEQVPLEVVKKIVEVDPPADATDELGEVPTPEKKTSRSVSRRPIPRHKR